MVTNYEQLSRKCVCTELGKNGSSEHSRGQQVKVVSPTGGFATVSCPNHLWAYIAGASKNGSHVKRSEVAAVLDSTHQTQRGCFPGQRSWWRRRSSSSDCMLNESRLLDSLTLHLLKASAWQRPGTSSVERGAMGRIPSPAALLVVRAPGSSWFALYLKL